MPELPPVYVISAARTPVGMFQGALSGLTAVQLGSHAIKGIYPANPSLTRAHADVRTAAVERAGIPSDSVQEVIFGNVLSAKYVSGPSTCYAAQH